MPPVPLHVLTGFLGSGKTTLLARVLRAPMGERIAALVNEIGDLPLDHHLLERVDDDVLALPSGCVCCALRDDLHAAVARVIARGPTRIVLETTGVADPAPIVHAVATDPRLAPLVRAGGVTAVVDALRAEDLLDREPEARRQVELADRIVLSKTDLAPHRVAHVRERLAREAPGCEVREAGAADARWLLDAPPLARLADAATARAWLHHAGEGPGCRTHAVSIDARTDVEALQLWLRLVTQLDALRLLRIKALVESPDGGIHVLQSAGASVSPPRRLERHAEGVRGLRMVIIERGLPAAAVEALLASARSAASGAPGAPSRQSAWR